MLTLFNVVVVTILLCGVSAWGLIAGRLLKREAILPYEPRRAAPWEPTDILILVFLYFVVGQACLATAVHISGVAVPKPEEEPGSQFQLVFVGSNLAAGVATFLAGILVLKARRGAT